MVTHDLILVVNAGSSSIKCALFTNQPTPEIICHIYVTGLGSHSHFLTKDSQGSTLTEKTLGNINHEQAFAHLLAWIEQQENTYNLIAAGHRIVHGGQQFTTPVLVTPTIYQQLQQLTPLAPLHQPHNLAPIPILQHFKHTLQQVACFDTAFHSQQPEIAQLFALPHALRKQGLKRYGFHGLSYEYILHSLPNYLDELPKRLIVAHLGNGASLTAIQDGRSLATTMGLTALDGLVMGTRCGTLDPGVILYLLQQGWSTQDLEKLLYHQSGLLGLSGISNDMQVLLQSETPQAALAIEVFIYRLIWEFGALVATLQGLDALIFTGGIGEHSAIIRSRVCEKLHWLGIHLDELANQQSRSQISTKDSPVSIWVIPTDEEKNIAQQVYNLINTSSTSIIISEN